MLKSKFTALCIFSLSLTFASHHEFEGISEAYNIRFPKMLNKFLPKNPTILEAGAYEGRDTCKLAKTFPTAKIFSFEPLPNAFKKLNKATEKFENVYIFNLALSNKLGKAPLYVCHGTNGKNPVFEFHSSLLPPIGPSSIHLMGPVTKVPCTTINEWGSKMNVKKIDFLWLSTEGNETQILREASRYLNRTNLIYVKSQLFHNRKGISLFTKLRKYLESNGFTLLSHFYYPNIYGDALFARTDLYNKNSI
ncbi:MAG: FkbM family methyltransferase [Simkaniaceae bacterium]|nr:FkbM family methyltransferase [Simkaniaceae bacterium]